MQLRALFSRYAPKNKEEIGRKREEMDLGQFFALLDDLRWLDNAFTQRDAVLCFVRGKMAPVVQWLGWLEAA